MTTTTLIVWKCAECGLPIFDGHGYIGTTVAPEGGPVTWTPWHDRCHPDTDITYDISVEQLRYPEQVSSWTEHLAAKRWHARSNWEALLAAHGVEVASVGEEPEAGASGQRAGL